MMIIPKPDKIINKSGIFLIKEKINIIARPEDADMNFITDFFLRKINSYCDRSLSIISTKNRTAEIVLVFGDTGLGPEGYILAIDTKLIMLTASKAAGIFYGIQTLIQIILNAVNDKSEKKNIPCCIIKDKPHFSWRGMHLDVSRHFFDKQFIKKYLDLLALHKMNKFHWHLTDDNGWRIEIRKYPELTDICAWRKDLEHLPWNERDHSDDPGNGLYGGFYSQDDIREIVKYAAERYIEVIPEIEMPGHSREVFAAFPQFSCRGKKLTVAPGGYWPNIDIFCAGNDKTFQFLFGILDEVSELFPSEYIHIGGDEADKTRWKECSRCQKRIQNEKLKDENELQSWFIQKIFHYLESKGKKMIGWDEILEGNLKAEATVMCWRGDGKAAAEMALFKDHEVIMCPNKSLYFDWEQTDFKNEKGAFGVTTLEKVYNYKLMPDNIDSGNKEKMIGAQGNVWTEWMPDKERVEYMTLPRLSALSEVVWTNDSRRDFNEFKIRLMRFNKVLEIFNYVSRNH